MYWLFRFLCLLLIAAVSSAVADSGASGKLEWAIIPDDGSTTATSNPAVYTLGAPLSNAHSIDVDEYGSIYVLDISRESVMRYSTTGELENLWAITNRNVLALAGCEVVHMRAMQDRRILVIAPCPLPTADDGEQSQDYPIVYGPDPAAFEGAINVVRPEQEACADVGPDGNLYWCLRDAKSVAVFSPDGKLLRRIDLSGAMTANGHFNTYSMRVDRNGDIYFVYRYNWIVRVDTKGRLLQRWNAYGTPGLQPILGHFQDIAVRDGIVYALIRYFDNDRTIAIQTYSPDGVCVARYECSKMVPDLPSSLAVHDDGSCAVVQKGKRNVVFLDPDGKPGPPLPMFYSHTSYGVVTGPNGGYFSAGGHGLEVLDSVGNLKSVVGQPLLWKTNEPVRTVVTQVARDPKSEDLWAITGNVGERVNTLSRFSQEGDHLQDVVFGQESVHAFGGLAVDSAGFFYSACDLQHTIRKIDRQDKIVATFGKKGSGLGELLYPSAAVIDNMGNVIVCDTGNSRIQVFSSTGEPLGVWGRRGRGYGEFDRPSGIAFGPNNTVWISDTFNDRIVKVPYDTFMKGLMKTPVPTVPEIVKEEPAPAPGKVSVIGVVIAGSEDIEDAVFIESPDRAWGMRVTLPEGVTVHRHGKLRISGVMEVRERGSRHLQASAVERLGVESAPISPLGIANLYVGDGYRDNRPSGLSNTGMLVRTWGRVVSVDRAKSIFVINDGSSTEQNTGLVVYAGHLRNPLADWPTVGQYIAVTGISSMYGAPGGSLSSCIRLRGAEEIRVVQ